MKKLPTIALGVSAGVLGGALSVWALLGDEAREFRRLQENSLCVLELPPGAPSARASFTTSQDLEQLYVGVRPGRSRESLSLSVSGSAGVMCSATTDATRFSWGREIPAGTYDLTLRQQAGSHGALVVVAAEKPAFVTGWQIWSRAYLGLLALSAVWVFVARTSNSARHRAASLYLFQVLLLALVALFFYLLFHEGGHALGEIAFGCYDFARSDFWGIHGTPHSGRKAGPPLEPWQQAVISGAGPLLPTFAGWALFLLWRSRIGRAVRAARPLVNLYFSAVVAMLVFPLIAVAGCLLGVISDGDWRGFITNIPGPLGVTKGLLWTILLVNAIILWRVVPQLRTSWKAQYRTVRETHQHANRAE